MLQSDDSLGHLSAEEKACLMFLEETIESLDTEEDSGLSNDEPDQLPGLGNVATKLADLSASMSKSKLNGKLIPGDRCRISYTAVSETHCSSSDKHVLVCLSGSLKPVSTEPLKKNVDAKPMQSYLVPTPLVLASSPPRSLPSTKLGNSPDKNLCSKAQFTPSSNKAGQKSVAPPAPLEVNVVIPPPTKPRDYSFRTAEGPLPRGPLSYDALVHLQRSASTKKTPLCPTIDHTIDLDKHLPATMEGQNVGKPPRSDRSHSEVSKPKTGPPAVAPKPKKIPDNLSVKTQNEAPITSDLSDSVNHAADPQVVRLEALQKLGLLKDQELENEMVASLSPPKSHSSLDPLPNRFTRGPPNVNTSRSPSFCYSQVPTEPKNRSLQSSSSFHQYSRHDHQPASVSHPAQLNGVKAASLERSATMDNVTNGGNGPELRHMTAAGPIKTTTAARPVSHKPSNAVSYTVMVVPGMGADRKEALRKLGLLKQ